MQLHGVMERAGTSCHGAGFGTYVSRQRIGEDREIGHVTDGAPHREGQPTAEAQNSTHLPQCLDTIGEELHDLLTKDHIEGTISNGKAAASPVRHSIVVIASRPDTARAASIMLAFRSIPTTQPSAPTQWAARRATKPVPYATSRTCSAGWSAATSTRQRTQGSRRASRTARRIPPRCHSAANALHGS